MSKITERREKTAAMEIDNKAILPQSDEKVKSYPSKKVLVALLIITAIISLFLLIVNAWVDSYASAFAPVDIDNAGATVTLTDLPQKRQVYYNEINEYLSKRPQFKAGYEAALLNYATASKDIKWAEGIYNYVVFIVDDVTGDYKKTGSITLVSFNANTSKISYSVIESSTLVYITSIGEGENKQDIVGPLYDSYLWGGEALLARTIQDNYGVRLNGYAALPYSAIIRMVDTFGTITVNDVSAETLAKVNETVAKLQMFPGFEDTKEVTLDVNSISIDGKQTVAYVKARENDDYNPFDDLATSMSKTIISGGVGNIVKALDVAKETVNASIKRYDFGALLQHAITNGASLDKSMTTGTTKKYYVPSVSICDYANERTALIDMIYPAKAEK